MRKQVIVNNEYYHIYNRGVDKRDIFSDKEDLLRFVESMKEFNQIDVVTSLSNLRKSQIESKALSHKKPLVSIIAYCLNPNHFHFILKQLEDGGISKFMQKVSGGYTYYFNNKNKRSGSLFQGTFKSHHVGSHSYFKKIIAYVNNNYQVHDIPEDKKYLILSSDFEYKNNKFNLVSKEAGQDILDIFKGSKKFETHCKEIVSIIREERGKISLLDEDNLPDRV